MSDLDDLKFNCSRRHFLSSASLGIGAFGLASLLDPRVLSAAGPSAPAAADGPLLSSPHFVPRVRRVIYLFQSGGPTVVGTSGHSTTKPGRFLLSVPSP